MIAKMERLLVVGRRSAAKDVLVSLQSLGVVQVEPLDPGDEDALRPLKLEGEDLRHKDLWDHLVSRSEALLDALDMHHEGPMPRGEVSNDPEALQKELAPVGDQIDRLVAERADARDELELTQAYLAVFRQLAPMMAQLEEATYLTGAAFMVADEDYDALEEAVDEELHGAFALAWQRHTSERLVVAAVLKRDLARLRAVFTRLGHSEIALPERYQDLGIAKAAHVMEERSQTLPKRIASIHEELGKLAAQHGRRLLAVAQVAHNHQARYERLQDLLEGRYGFALSGWVPADDSTRVVEALRKQFAEQIQVAARPADEHHDRGVPVKLDNPAWIRPFQGLLALFEPPRYGSFDPSWTLAVFFPLFFGMQVGDIGYGLLFATIGWWVRRRGAAGKNIDTGPIHIIIPARILRPLSTVIFWLAGWTIAFGFVYGEFFGNLFERIPASRPLFYTLTHGAEHHDGLIRILLLRVEVFGPLLLASTLFGVLQVLGGWLIRIIYSLRHGESLHLYEALGMFSGLVGVVVFATGYQLHSVNTLVVAVTLLMLAAFVVFTVLAKNGLMVLELISNGGHILSYLRIFAVGLASALIANLSIDLGFSLSGVLPIVGPILGILVGAIVIMIALALTIISDTLQPLRLHYVEFFTKFGFYDESGRPYRPFRLLGGKS
ncbi:MAG: V-type ATPase 116kDa subunit family protein [Deinococcales bacterium]